MRFLAASLIVLSLAFASAGSAQTIYQYTGNSYTTIIDNTPPAGTFDTSMNIGGTFTVAAPLTPNMAFGDIGGSIVSYSFTTG